MPVKNARLIVSLAFDVRRNARQFTSFLLWHRGLWCVLLLGDRQSLVVTTIISDPRKSRSGALNTAHPQHDVHNSMCVSDRGQWLIMLAHPTSQLLQHFCDYRYQQQNTEYCVLCAKQMFAGVVNWDMSASWCIVGAFNFRGILCFVQCACECMRVHKNVHFQMILHKRYHS